MNILIVDDQVISRKFLRAMLEPKRQHIAEAANGVDLSECHIQPDLEKHGLTNVRSPDQRKTNP